MDVNDKILKLGGIKANPLCKGERRPNNEEILNFEKNNNLSLPESFSLFMLNYSPFSFNNPVNIKYQNKELKKSCGLEYLPVDYFYSFYEKSKCSILSLRQDYLEQIPKEYLPFCDGELGDLWCIAIEGENYGEIYYFSQGAKENKLFKIADSFDSFLKHLFVVKEDAIKKSDTDITATYSDKLISLINKWKQDQ